jgi:hypothetical protein
VVRRVLDRRRATPNAAPTLIVKNNRLGRTTQIDCPRSRHRAAPRADLVAPRSLGMSPSTLHSHSRRAVGSALRRLSPPPWVSRNRAPDLKSWTLPTRWMCGNSGTCRDRGFAGCSRFLRP